MELLSAIAIQLLRHAEKDMYADYIDSSHEIVSSTVPDVESVLPGDRLNRVGTRYEDDSIRARSGARHGRKDRSAWGSYTENCPPILPPNASITGFEEEAFFLAGHIRKRRQQELFVNDYDEATDDEDDEEELQEGGERTVDGPELASVDGLNVNSGRTLMARSTRDLLPSFTALTHSVHFPTLALLPSSLFGSTTRPSRRVLTPANRRNNSVTQGRLTNMAALKSYWWVSLWFLLTAPVIFWDAGYCFMRPRSFAGGDLHWIWEPYSIYQEVDYVYGVETYNRGDGFTNAQSFMNVVETFLNLYYVYAQHVLGTPSAPLIGFAAAIMTLSKTALYWLQEYYCGGCAIGHSDLKTLIIFWIIPNGLWLLIPSMIISRLGRDIVSGLTASSKVSSSKKNK